MRKSFEQTLVGTYRDLALEQLKQEKSAEISDAEKEELGRVLEWHSRNKAEQKLAQPESRITPGQERTRADLAQMMEKEKGIVELQRQKQKIVEDLEAERKSLNNPDYKPRQEPGSCFVRWEDGKLIAFSPRGGRQEITSGEIFTDFEFGINYHLDPASVPREIRKKYALEKARRRIQGLLEEQIVLDEENRGNDFVGEGVAIKRNIMAEKKHIEGGAPAGFLAEIMVANFLDKLSIDTGIDLKFIKTDVYEDVAHKIDFVIRRKYHNRGVKAEADDGEKSRVGIQFTINRDPSKLVKKQQQVKAAKKHLGREIELDDIVLVNIPISHLNQIYDHWLKAGRPSGGPDKLWDKETKHRIVEGVLQGMMTPEEIQAVKDKIR